MRGNYMLNDNDLEKVTGGMTNNEIINKINSFYCFLPEDIRNKIIDALNNYGKKAAKALAEKLTSSIPQAEGIVDLFV